VSVLQIKQLRNWRSISCFCDQCTCLFYASDHKLTDISAARINILTLKQSSDIFSFGDEWIRTNWKVFFRSGPSTEVDLACEIHHVDDGRLYFKINTFICMEL